MNKQQLIIVLWGIVGISFIYQNGIFAQPTLKVSGIVIEEEPFAIVNGKIVREGDDIEGIKVIEILENSVRFEYKNNTFIRKIGESVEVTHTSFSRNRRDKDREDSQMVYNYPFVKVTEVNKVVLKMFHEFKKFRGYLIFYNKKGEQCVVEPLINATYRYQIPWIKGVAANKVFVEKELDVTPDKFKYLILRSGDEILAYPIELFVEGNFHEKDRIFFEFNWLNLKDREECFLESD